MTQVTTGQVVENSSYASNVNHSNSRIRRNQVQGSQVSPGGNFANNNNLSNMPQYVPHNNNHSNNTNIPSNLTRINHSNLSSNNGSDQNMFHGVNFRLNFGGGDSPANIGISNGKFGNQVVNNHNPVSRYSNSANSSNLSNNTNYYSQGNQSDDGKASYSKKPRNIDFKPYTQEDYRMINQPVKLGSLGPDLNNEELIEKKKKQEKMKEYAKNISTLLSSRKKTHKPQNMSPPKPEPSEDVVKKSEARKKALEFAARIPRPRVVRRKNSGQENGSTSSSNDDSLSPRSRLDGEPEPMTELERLELKHREDQTWLKNIKDQLY